MPAKSGALPISSLKEDNDPWKFIAFSVELIGDFADSMRFLEKVENSHYFIKAKKLHVSSTTPEGQTLTTIEFKAYTR